MNKPNNIMRQAGFTLLEVLLVIVLTGILAGMMAMFIRAPVQGYVDSARRAEMTDVADTALRRIGRDLRTAVPNSVRLPAAAGSTYIEFLPTIDGSKYRGNPSGSTNKCGGSALGDALSFDAIDICFEILGPQITFTTGDMVVIGSTQSSGNLPYLAEATPGSIRRSISAAGVGTMQVARINSTVALPSFAELQGHRFSVVPGAQQAVTYACLNNGVNAAGDGTGSLVRYWGYGFNVMQAAPPIPAGSSALLANNVSACNFVYDISNQRNSLVALRLSITRGGESVSLYHEIHVNNVP